MFAPSMSKTATAKYSADHASADVYVKDEGYAEVKFKSKDAKLMAVELGIPNQLPESKW